MKQIRRVSFFFINIVDKCRMTNVYFEEWKHYFKNFIRVRVRMKERDRINIYH